LARRLQRSNFALEIIGLFTKTVQQALLNHNAKVYIASRNAQKAEEAIKDLEKETGKEAHFIKLDLADLKSIKAAAEDFARYF
jgi:retinol dehydrogenase-12